MKRAHGLPCSKSLKNDNGDVDDGGAGNIDDINVCTNTFNFSILPS